MEEIGRSAWLARALRPTLQQPRGMTAGASSACKLLCIAERSLAGSTAGAPVEIWFQDEARVGQNGTLSYVWAPVGSCPPMVRDNRHDTAYMLGAICPARGIGAAIIPPAANTECTNLHL